MESGGGISFASPSPLSLEHDIHFIHMVPRGTLHTQYLGLEEGLGRLDNVFCIYLSMYISQRGGKKKSYLLVH